MTAQQVRSGATDRWRVRAGRGAAPLLRRRRHVPAAARCRLQRSTPAAPCGPVPTSVRVGYAAGSWLVLPPRLRAVPNTRAAHAGSGAPSRSSERQRAAPPAYSSLLATAPPLLPPRPPRQVTAFKLDPARLAALNRVLRGMRVGNFEFAADQLRLGDLQGNRWEGERGACLGGGGGRLQDVICWWTPSFLVTCWGWAGRLVSYSKAGISLPVRTSSKLARCRCRMPRMGCHWRTPYRAALQV